MKRVMIWAFLAAALFPAQAQAQGYEGLFAPQSDYETNAARGSAAPQGESYGGYDGVLAPVEGPAPAEIGGYYGGTEAGGFAMPAMGLDGGEAAAGEDFYSLVVTGAPKTTPQIREMKRQSLEEAKKKRVEETRRINAEAKQQRDLVRQEKARKQAELDRLRLEQAQKQAQAQAQR